jgi:NTP pyrophosphatase (non-canonical NTP hydrolase)
MVNLLAEEIVETLRGLQFVVGNLNEEKGFHSEGEGLYTHLDNVRGTAAGVDARANLRRYWSEKLLLIVSEATEALDELRSGKDVHETYYPTSANGTQYSGPVDNPVQHKPEGVPSEIADIVIRCFDFAYESGIDLSAMINEKLAYNETRPYKHGKKF